MRLSQRLSILLFILVVVVGGILLFRQKQPDQNPLQALGFDVCNGKLCFHSVAPGVTPMRDAIGMLYPLSETVTNYIILYKGLGIGCCQGDPDNGTVAKIDFSVDSMSTTIRVEHLVALNDATPCKIEFSSDGYFVYVYLPQFTVTAIDSQKVGRSSPMLYEVKLFSFHSRVPC